MLPAVPDLHPQDGFLFTLDVAQDATASAYLAEPVSSAARVDYRGDRTVIGARLNVQPRHIDIYLAFNDPGQTVEYQNLRFGFDLTLDGQPVSLVTHPPANVTYVRSDQGWLKAERAAVLPYRTYALRLWAEDHGHTWDAVWDIATPRPAQPYPSWTWVDVIWQPPVPVPTSPPAEGFYWRWDEPSLAWVEEALP